MMALKEAADDADSQASNMDDNDSMDQDLVCPKCGHKGKEHEFLLPAGQSSNKGPDISDSQDSEEY